MIKWSAMLLGLFLMPGAAFADTSLRPLTQRSDTLGWEAVGRIDIGAEGFCTGVLVASDLVLTAGHCLYARDTLELRDPTTFLFRAGLRGEDAVEERRVRRAVVHPDYTYAEPDLLKRIRYDIALLQLESAIPTAFAAPFAPISNVRDGAQVQAVSFAAGRADAPSIQRACGVKFRLQGVLVLSCDTTFGASGAPVFYTSFGRPHIAALVSSGGELMGEEVTYGMDVAAPLARLKADLRAGRGVFPAESFSARRVLPGAARGTTGARFLKP